MEFGAHETRAAIPRVNEMLELAAALGATPRDALIAALRSRRVNAATVHDHFDLAEALLTDESIDHALARLDREELAILAYATHLGAGSRQPFEAVATALSAASAATVSAEVVAERSQLLAQRLIVVADESGILVPEEVATRVRSWSSRELPDARNLAAPPDLRPVPSLESGDQEAVDRLAAERAFRTVGEIAEIVATLIQEPARELSRGGLALPDVKRLAEATGRPLEDVPTIAALTARLGLITEERSAWLASQQGHDWLLGDTASRWRWLADAWRNALPHEVRATISKRPAATWGDPLRADVAEIYPAGGTWLAELLDKILRDGEALGIGTDDQLSTMGRLALDGDLHAAADVLDARLPDSVDRVYLQHDLSIVSPGPLEPTIDARLRLFADVEGRELAATYRVSAPSVNRALAAGETAESIIDFLRSISLTGIPQPLQYLVTETAARYGRVRVGSVGTDEFPARSYVRSDDTGLLTTIAVDQSISSLGLQESGPHRLLSRFTPDVVLWTLSDARYPVAAEDSNGNIVHLHRGNVAASRSSSAPLTDPIVELVDRLLASGTDAGSEQAWLERQLEAAARAKRPVLVSVRMPGDTISEYVLEPTSIANGRMRARDRNADIERTLPLSAIAGIKPVGS